MRQKKALALTAAVCIAAAAEAGWLMKRPLWPAEYMSLHAVCKRWGERPLDTKKFKASAGNRPVRAQMACSLLKSQEKYKGLSAQQTREIFGPPTGFFFNESFIAYLINKAEKQDKNVWQILFLIGKDQKTSEIKIHKNCCYK